MSLFSPKTKRGMRTDLPTPDNYDRSQQDRYVAPKKSRFWYIFFGVITFILLHFFTQYIAIQIQAIANGIHISSSRAIIPILLGRFHNYITLLFTIGLTAIVVVLLAQLNNVQDSVDDNSKRMLEHDVDDAFVEDPLDIPSQLEMTIVPDTKAHFAEDVTSLLSHVALSNKGVKGKDGRVSFDKKFMNDLFEIATVPKEQRQWFNPTDISYNPNKTYGKLPYKTVADLINNTWHVPDYETGEGIAGAYITSTGPGNTIVITETRGGKGQKYIEPILNVWSRQDDKPNLIVTDLKMELLRMNITSMTYRGYNVRSLNLMVPEKTDMINLIGYAVNAAIRGDITETAETVNSISDIYFPPNPESENAVFTSAAASIFKRSVLGMIDFYREEVYELSQNPTLSADSLYQRSEELWGRVTLYNAYLFVVETGSKKYDDPELTAITQEEIDEYEAHKQNVADGVPDRYQPPVKLGMDLFFDATELLPENDLRAKILTENKALGRIKDSEKMLASAYGVALFGMIFFTDSKIIRLTSARPAENIDLVGFAFPRRMAVKFEPAFARKKRFLGALAKWRFFKDPERKIPYEGEDYTYNGRIDAIGWADCVLKGFFENDKTYVELEIFDSKNNLKLDTYTFVFQKSYRKNYQGTAYIRNPLTNEREVLNALIYEYTPQTDAKGRIVDRPYTSTITVSEHPLLLNKPDMKPKPVQRAVIQTFEAHYAEKPVALFLVAPPHLSSYNRLILVAIDLIYNQSVAKGLVLRSEQQPFLMNKYMLDEFGNMKSGDTGVPNLGMKLTSGLGSKQQMTLILQSFKQLETNYPKEAETIKGACNKIFYMKSKDDEVIENCIKMNGVKHVVQMSSQNTVRPVGLFLSNFITNQSISESRTREERPVISKNKYLRLNENAYTGRSIVSTGGNPILSEGAFILPMSFRLLANDIGTRKVDPMNLPTMSDTLGFDAQANVPDFDVMIAKRVEQAKLAPKVIELYKKVNHLTDSQILQIPNEIYADTIMRGIMNNLNEMSANALKKQPRTLQSNVNSRGNDLKNTQENIKLDSIYNEMAEPERKTFTKKAINRTKHQIIKTTDEDVRKASAAYMELKAQTMRTNAQESELAQTNANASTKIEELKSITYCNGLLTKLDLIDPATDIPVNTLNDKLADVYSELLGDFKNDTTYFSVIRSENGGQSLYDVTGKTLYINDLNTAGVPMERFDVKPAFMKFLVSFNSWSMLLNGRFENELIRILESYSNYE